MPKVEFKLIHAGTIGIDMPIDHNLQFCDRKIEYSKVLLKCD